MTDHHSKNPLAALGAKIQKAFTPSTHADTSSAYSSEAGFLKDRSQSRGREQKTFQSSGRGGAGNIRLRSTSRDRSQDGPGPEDYSDVRGRTIEPTPGKAAHTGRGGAGNVRSPSADPAAERQEAARERSVIAAKTEEEKALPHSTGRGGFGNIDRSRSRSRNPDPVHSTGKGGYGNIVAGTVPEEHDDEKERKAAHKPAAAHSSGRGGAGNVATGEGPPVEALDKLKLSEGGSTGRGGAGNIIG